ncbi:MAG: class II aldolase/adducin family protein [Deltaproteobacteria bacterium]|nr:MAG: class II aldolase/adducin family protein [Deltaproteobacteria bacterium]
MEHRLRRSVVEICRRMYERGFIAATDGNVSVRLAADRILVTPSGVNKGYLSEGDLVVVDRSGRKLSGRGSASSEIRMHLAVYALRPDVRAVVHAHPPLSIAFSIAGESLAQCMVPEVIVSLGDVPTAPYATPTTADVPKMLEPLVLRYDAIMLERHGSLTLGRDLEEAYNRLETMEHTAKISLAVKQIGKFRPLPKEEVDRLVAMGRALGLTRAHTACQTCGLCDIEIPGGSTAGEGGREPAPSQNEAPPDRERLVAMILEEIGKLSPR